jgi:hypothetical protein
MYEGVSKNSRNESTTNYMLTTIITPMAAKLTRLTHKNSDTTACSGRELYHMQFSLQVASPELFGNTLIKQHAYQNSNLNETNKYSAPNL